MKKKILLVVAVRGLGLMRFSGGWLCIHLETFEDFTNSIMLCGQWFDWESHSNATPYNWWCSSVCCLFVCLLHFPLFRFVYQFMGSVSMGKSRKKWNRERIKSYHSLLHFIGFGVLYLYCWILKFTCCVHDSFIWYVLFFFLNANC